MKVISYNLRKHRAATELRELVERHGADLLCLQEADTTDIPDDIGGLVGQQQLRHVHGAFLQHLERRAGVLPCITARTRIGPLTCGRSR